MANNTKIRTIDESVFSNYGEDAEYWCGKLATDGCIGFCRTSTVPCIRYGSIDVEHVYKFREFLKADYVVHFSDRQTSFGLCKFASMSFTSREIGEFLICNGITPHKSLTLKLSDRLAKSRHCWRGAMDGDGVVGLYGKTARPIVRLASGSFQFINQFAEFCVSIGLRPLISNYLGNPSGHPLYHVGFGSGQAVQLLHALYDDASVYLDRKKAKVDLIFAQPVRAERKRLLVGVGEVRIGANVVQ